MVWDHFYAHKMPFSYFKTNFCTCSKRYHTAAKNNHSTTAFFDSSFNHIRQHSQLVSHDSLASHAGRFIPNPHPANAAGTNFLQFDYSCNSTVLVNDDDTNNNNSGNNYVQNANYMNPIPSLIPFSQEQLLLALSRSSYQQIGKLIPPVNVAEVIQSSNSKFIHRAQQSQLQHYAKRELHTASKLNVQPVSVIPKQQEQTSGSSPTLVEPALKHEIVEEIQTDETFLNQQITQIMLCFNSKKYEKVNALYMAIKRNGIVPPREIYAIVLRSIALRSMDESLDEQLSTMLTVYEDLITNKIKPDLSIYSVVIEKLLNSSIDSFIENSSNNGADFFKIAIDIFNASNCSHIQEFNAGILNSMFIGMNLYPGFIDTKSLIRLLNKDPHFAKNHLYFMGLINYCKFTNDSSLAIKLYEEFKSKSDELPQLKQNQFLIYSTFISTLIETDEIPLATKFLDKLLTSIKNYENYESKVSMLLSCYLLSLAKVNPNKSYEIWNNFIKIDWIPDFSYKFYSNLLDEVLEFYPLSLEIYNYMSALPTESRSTPLSSSKTKTALLESILVSPASKDSISRFLLSAIQVNDKSTILKIIKESFIRQTTFELSVYPYLIQYLQNKSLITTVINSHGLKMEDKLKFLNYISSITESNPQLSGIISYLDISKTKFFKQVVNSYSIQDTDIFGILKVFEEIFKSSKDQILNIELCSPIIVEFHDVANHYNEINSAEVLNFKKQITKYFQGLIENVDSMESNQSFSQTTLDAIKLLKEPLYNDN